MDYYAAWPAWKMPKWVGVTLGVVFTVIAGASAFMIVELTRPPGRSVVAAIAAAVAPAAAAIGATPATTPKLETARTATPSKVEAANVAAAGQPEPAPATAAVAAAAPAAAAPAQHAHQKAKHASDLSPARKRSILAKRESKSSRQAKSDIDRLLGL